MQQSVLIQIAGSGRVPLDPKPELVERLSRRGSLENKEALEQRLQRAERNRQELTMKRIAKKARHQRNMPSGSDMVATKLKLRMERATKKHSAALEQRRSKAARFLARRADALARAQMQREQQLEKASQEQLQQETVESRREFLQQLHLERLRQEHNWVQSRMLMRKGQDLMRDKQRLIMEERMSLADQARTLQLGLRAARAGVAVARARALCHAAKARAFERVETSRAKLAAKLAAAEERRLALQRSPSKLSPRASQAMSASGASPRTSMPQ